MTLPRPIKKDNLFATIGLKGITAIETYKHRSNKCISTLQHSDQLALYVKSLFILYFI